VHRPVGRNVRRPVEHVFDGHDNHAARSNDGSSLSPSSKAMTEMSAVVDASAHSPIAPVALLLVAEEPTFKHTHELRRP
jgi:hypothetical protein